MKIYALMPAQKVIQVEAVQALIAMQADIYNNGDNFNIAFTNGHNPVLARISLMRHAAIQENVDYVLWLDSDHIYRAKALYTLIEKMNKENLDALSAGYLVRGPCETFAHGRHLEDGTFKQFEKKDCEGIVDADVLGFGFFLMKHSFVKSFVDKHGTDLFHMDYKDNSTEDVYFCRKMKEDGYRVCFDADTIVGHLMTWVNK
jgi:hypothetical protein